MLLSKLSLGGQLCIKAPSPSMLVFLPHAIESHCYRQLRCFLVHANSWARLWWEGAPRSTEGFTIYTHIRRTLMKSIVGVKKIATGNWVRPKGLFYEKVSGSLDRRKTITYPTLSIPLALSCVDRKSIDLTCYESRISEYIRKMTVVISEVPIWRSRMRHTIVAVSLLYSSNNEVTRKIHRAHNLWLSCTPVRSHDFICLSISGASPTIIHSPCHWLSGSLSIGSSCHSPSVGPLLRCFPSS